jgi:hypothetical protein
MVKKMEIRQTNVSGEVRSADAGTERGGKANAIKWNREARDMHERLRLKA